jgi:hypothetical protein
MREVLQMIDAKAQSRPAPVEFELAYQARVAMDRIRFAIKHTEQFAPHTDPMREVGLQLLDALQRLETADRRFQERSRLGSFCRANQRKENCQTSTGENATNQPMNGSWPSHTQRSSRK